ncbi:MAG: 30S ribosomal protein S8 [bacterium]
MHPISDMLIKIKNAQAVWHPTVDIAFSKIKYEIASILEREGFIGKVEKKKKKIDRYGKIKPVIEIVLKYLPSDQDRRGLPGISGIKIVSKPGQRIYLPYSKIRKIKSGYGMSVISTSKGLMSDKEARNKKTGGEVICEIW